MINVVLTLFNRIDYLKKQLESLVLQTLANEIQLYVLSNNPNINFKAILDEYSDKLNIKFIQKNNELKTLERHYYVYQQNFDYVIYLDDDIILNPTDIEKLIQFKKPKTYASGFGRVFENGTPENWYLQNEPICGGFGLNSKKPKNVKYFDYVGAGFSIIDCSIYKSLFKCYDTLPVDIKQRVNLIDDIFISWFIVNSYEKLNTNIYIDLISTDDQYATYRNIMHVKAELVNDLNNIKKWKKNDY